MTCWVIRSTWERVSTKTHCNFVPSFAAFKSDVVVAFAPVLVALVAFVPVPVAPVPVVAVLVLFAAVVEFGVVVVDVAVLFDCSC